ncbi:Endopolyphosphatase [Polyplosphaeria fusca]|uniref:Endopolyphosphatase n=1 Tax=Polyplosphaeria fusca TaxID=682080 RepID=A0A9P4R1W8_9PLEO|nr:Endopolyphosphatase [Polyplosphaeria fusca]
MLHARGALVLGLCLLLDACRGAPQTGAGTTFPAAESTPSGRRLHGRFLHITDVHPDPFYKTYSSTKENAACHRKRGPAGIYGAETSACDTPYSLANATFAWINEKLKDSIDFVVWTGDSARHDNDEKLPRTPRQVIEQNEFVVHKFAEVFGKGENDTNGDPTNDFKIPIVPTFGNNDILPHNIFLQGPNRWTTKYLKIWRGLIPEAQRHQFQQGGWFYVEVIPGKLAVISLNTLYFFDSNSGVDGCADKHEPGYEHMEWLRIQLQIMRERGMKAILMGHVPPARTNSKLSWDETCWQKYTLWLRQYRDVLVGELFGHMNIDHFMLHDYKDLKKETKDGRMGAMDFDGMDIRESMFEDGEVTVASASDYLLDLRDAWARLPMPSTGAKELSAWEDVDEDEERSMLQWVFDLFAKKKKGQGDKKKFLDDIGGKYASRYGISHVSPSVVPNYFPTLRVFEYNITGLEDMIIESPAAPSEPVPQDPDYLYDADFDDTTSAILAAKKKKKERQLKKRKTYKFKIPKAPSKSAPPGPAYSPQSLTLLGYTQWFANLTHINNDFVEPPTAFERHMKSASQEVLSQDDQDLAATGKWKEGKHHKHQGKQPRPKPHPKKFKFEIEYDTSRDKVFKLKDLTVRSYVDLARRIGQEEKKVLVAEGAEEGEDVDTFDEEEDVDAENKKGKKHKKKKKKKKHGKSRNKTWFAFVTRAFVGTMDPRDIEETFAWYSASPDNSTSEENMEL